MKVFRVVIEPAALKDIEESIDWLSERAPHKVNEWLESLQFSLESLSQLPDRCSLAPLLPKTVSGALRKCDSIFSTGIPRSIGSFS